MNTKCKFTLFSRCTFNWIRLLYYNPLKPRGLHYEDEWCSRALTMNLCHAVHTSLHLYITYCQKKSLWLPKLHSYNKGRLSHSQVHKIHNNWRCFLRQPLFWTSPFWKLEQEKLNTFWEKKPLLRLATQKVN